MEKWVAFPLVIVVIFFVVVSHTDDYKDSVVWNKFRKYLTEEQVTQISINGQTLSQNEKMQVLQWLRTAKYKKSNRIGEGPTPEITLTVSFKDNKFVYFGYWGENIFEIGPRFIEPSSQFLIKSEELAKFITKNKVYY